FEGGWATAFNTQGWLPCDADPAHKATLALGLRVPAGLTVFASGELLARERVMEDRERLRFRLARPHSAYLFGMVAGPFETRCETVGGVRVCAAATLAHAAALSVAVEVAARALPF